MSYGSISQSKLLPTKLDTPRLFDVNYTENNAAPIDLFISNTRAINQTWIQLDELTAEFASMVLLSYMSAFESYMRAIIRGAVNIDRTCQKIVAPHRVSFAAAIYHNNNILPEALLEETSFSDANTLKNSLTRFLGIEIKPNAMLDFFNEFEKICELRHCCTHRFGKLGTKNAINLGIDIHSKILEKPLKLSKQNLENALDTITDLAKTLNSLIFVNLLDRTVCRNEKIRSELIAWKWDLRMDKKFFKPYYDLFATKLDAKPSAPLKLVYYSFKKANKMKKKRG